MIERKIQGFVYSRSDYQENDVIVNVLTKDGPVSFKARGIKKTTSKNAPSCNFFTLSDFLLTAKSENHPATLKSSSIVKIFHQPYENLLSSAVYLFFCHLVHTLANTLNPYDFLLECFQLMEKKEYPINVLNYFFKSLVDQLGYQPFLKGCVHCHQKNQLIAFSFSDGGFICQTCFDLKRHHQQSVSFLKDLYQFYQRESYWPLSETHAITLLNLYTEFLLNEVGFSLRGMDFIRQCL